MHATILEIVCCYTYSSGLNFAESCCLSGTSFEIFGVKSPEVDPHVDGVLLSSVRGMLVV